jgi:phosphoglycolate phosphatase-like HAD superfamily hydrolase
MLEHSGIRDFFDFVATAEFSKDKTEKFEMIKKKYHVSDQDILFITDALGDVKEAKLAAVPTIAVTWGVHDHTYFNKESYDNLIGVVHSISELKDFIVAE